MQVGVLRLTLPALSQFLNDSWMPDGELVKQRMGAVWLTLITPECTGWAMLFPCR